MVSTVDNHYDFLDSPRKKAVALTQVPSSKAMHMPWNSTRSTPIRMTCNNKPVRKKVDQELFIEAPYNLCVQFYVAINENIGGRPRPIHITYGISTSPMKLTSISLSNFYECDIPSIRQTRCCLGLAIVPTLEHKVGPFFLSSFVLRQLSQS